MGRIHRCHCRPGPWYLTAARWSQSEEDKQVRKSHARDYALMGLGHEALTYRYAGRDFRLTDVKGSVIRDVFA